VFEKGLEIERKLLIRREKDKKMKKVFFHL
jgi:hypothetical protein